MIWDILRKGNNFAVKVVSVAFSLFSNLSPKYLELQLQMEIYRECEKEGI